MLGGATPYEAARKRAVFVLDDGEVYEITRVSRSNDQLSYAPKDGNHPAVTITAAGFNARFVGWRDNKEAERTANFRRILQIAQVWDYAHKEYDEERMAQAFHSNSFEDAMAVVRDVQQREQEAAQKEIDRLEDENQELYSASYSCACDYM